MNRAAADAGADNLLFHSGAVEADGTGVLLPGASGSGKSTLTAGLVRAGLGYLTDELAALHMTSGKLVPYPKPITVKPGSFAALADIGPDASRRPDRARGRARSGRWRSGRARDVRSGHPACPAS